MSAETLFTLLFGILLATCVSADQYRCLNPNGKHGYCYSISLCSSLYELTGKANLTNSEIRFLRQSKCDNGYGCDRPFLCCTADIDFTSSIRSDNPQKPPRNHLLPVEPNCGPAFIEKKIMNGEDAGIFAFPWIALLEYEKDGVRSHECGGTLINHRYVVTAAHCVGNNLNRLTRVRFGEYDISNEIDCEQTDCNDFVVDVEIEKAIAHPMYNVNSSDHHNDIALVRLARDVQYTQFIKPVCLPLLNAGPTIKTNDLLTVSGWGFTHKSESRSKIKQRLEVPVYDHDDCVHRYQEIDVDLIPSQLCAGGESGKGSCYGDSGGPLMRQTVKSFWYLEGIISSGHRDCGVKGWPDVYTLVKDFIDWIHANVHA